MAMFKESYLLEICTEIFADEMKKHLTKSLVHCDPIFIKKRYVEYRPRKKTRG